MLDWKDDPISGEYTPIPTNGCGYSLCFRETEYTIDEGEFGIMIIHYDGAQQPVDGTVMIIAGAKFTISNTDNNTPSEIYAPLGSDADTWILALNTALQSRTEFRSYDIVANTVSDIVTITTKEKRYAPEFDQTDLASSDTSYVRGSDAGFPETNGAEPIYKEDYYVFLRLIDNETGEPICEEDFEVPLNILSDGTNVACFELSQIVKQLPDIYITPPDIADPLYFEDTNQVKHFSIEVYGKYKDPNADCGKIQTNQIEVGTQDDKSGFPFMRFIQQIDSGLNLNDISDGLLWMTDKPESYEVCKDSPLYFRWHRKIHQYNGTNYTMNFEAVMTYGDGTTETIDEEIVNLTGVPVLDWTQSEIHVLNLGAILFDSAYFNQDKTFLKLVFKITYIQDVGADGDATEEYSLIFDNDPQGHCCGCHVHFLFAGERGNNDAIVARCESVVSLEVDFIKIGRTQECGEYTGGNLTLSATEIEEAKTVWIYHDDWEYLSKFLASPIKYIKKEVGTEEQYVRVYPTETSYEIYRANNAGRLKFKYVESINKKGY